ncbi:S8 family serine peptidase [Aminipila butyrica]|uniref:S8 family serine peptidase n=1 Tax=Aminipila butyrica TaxID=433296 RepID=A0A858BSB9_9FIRM|nr:S8 family serine peptidase [Aminipila butyrica]QIB68803.1 S8 family serine peptidase [Aminipila butyrica]
MATALLPQQAFAAELPEEPSVFMLAEDLSQEATEAGADYNGYIFKLKGETNRTSLSRRAALFQENDEISPLEYMPGYYTAESLETLKETVDESNIEFIEPDYIVTLHDEPGSGTAESINDDHLELMHVPSAWANGLTGADLDRDYDMGNDGNSTDQIVVAVVDSGLAEGHEDIDYDQVIPGKSFVAGADSTVDTLGHGTFVAGEIIAVSENNIGIAGIAQSAYVMPLKAFIAKETEISNIINAINYATQQREAFDQSNGASGSNICILNLSLGGEDASLAMESAVNEAIAAGIIVIASAGNDGETIAGYPAQYAIGVGSTNAEGAYSDFSQILSDENGKGYENKVWVTAPGEDYTSTWYNGSYKTSSGTSFSAPQVSALAAISVGIKNNLTDITGDSTNHAAFKALLKETADYQDSGTQIAGQDIYYGWGIIDFAEMTEKLLNISENIGKDSAVSFSVNNGAGTLLTVEANHLAITVTPEGSDIPEIPQEGIYTLKIGTKYDYTITADKFKTASGQFIPVTATRVLNIAMEGKDYGLRFSVKNTAGQEIANPIIFITKTGGTVLLPLPDGSFAVKNGTYTYTVSANDYYSISGTFTINDSEQTYENDRLKLEVELTGPQDVCNVQFAVSGSDGAPYAEISVRDESGSAIAAYFDKAWNLGPGGYTYTIESDYYNAISGSFTVNEGDKGSSRTISEVMNQRLYWVFFDVMPLSVMALDTTTLAIKDGQEKMAQPYNEDPGQYRLPNGTYTYSIKADGYKTSSGNFTVDGSVLYVSIQLEKGADAPVIVPGDNGGGSSSGGSGGGGGAGGGSIPSNNASQPADTKNTADVLHKRFNVQTEDHDFTDVGRTSWYYEPINYVATLGLYNGLSNTQFAPDTPMTRGMMATVLFRLSGAANSADKHNFSDVAEGSYYANAVTWGAEHKVFQGISESAFSPNREITREQLITALYRYALYAKLTDSSADNNAAKAFQDFSAVSEYSEEAVSWAYKNDILEGDSRGLIRPAENATRAEVAAMVTRFINNVILKEV